MAQAPLVAEHLIFGLIVRNDQAALIDLLRQDEVAVTVRNRFGNTPLHKACQLANIEIATILLGHPVDINARGIDDCTPFYYAVYKRDVALTRLLAAHGADIELPNSQGSTPLFNAVSMYAGNDEILRALLELGANPKIPNKHGVTLYELLDMPKNEAIKGLF